MWCEGYPKVFRALAGVVLRGVALLFFIWDQRNNQYKFHQYIAITHIRDYLLPMHESKQEIFPCVFTANIPPKTGTNTFYEKHAWKIQNKTLHPLLHLISKTLVTKFLPLKLMCVS